MGTDFAPPATLSLEVRSLILLDYFSTIGDSVAVKASKNRQVHQVSTSRSQQVQYESLKNNWFQLISTRFGIWFGTRGSGRQPSCKSFRFNAKIFPDVERCGTLMFLRLQNRLQRLPKSLRPGLELLHFKRIPGCISVVDLLVLHQMLGRFFVTFEHLRPLLK